VVVAVEHDRPNGSPQRQARRAARELLEPPQPHAPRNRGVRGRRRREDEQPGVAEAPILDAQLRVLAERAPIGLLADEADPARTEVARELLQPLGRAFEIRSPKVA
jgi:hypothetical protein